MDNDNTMNFSTRFLRRVARFLCVWVPLTQVFFVADSYAAGILFPKSPLAASVESVKPNVLFMLDDSTSMGLDFLPDYVRFSTELDPATHASKFGNCFDTGDTNRDITGNPSDCMIGDPPHMSPDFNGVYYNPSISYAPPVNADGTSFPAQTTFTAVATDPYGQQQKDQLDNQVSTVNLTTGYPDRVWCISPSDSPSNTSACVRNTNPGANATAYRFPDDVYKYGFDYDGIAKYTAGNPYFYSLVPTTYCDNAERQNWRVESDGVSRSGHCQDIGSPAGAYQFEAPVQWCEYNANSSVIDYVTVATYYTAANKCQGKKVGNYSYPRFLGMVSGATVTDAPYAQMSIQTSPAPNQHITAIQVGNAGPNIIGAEIITNSSDTAATVASSIAQAINTQTSPVNVDADAVAIGGNPWEFIACAGNGTSGSGCRQSPFDTFIIDPTGVPSDTVYVFPARYTGTPMQPVPYGPQSPRPYTITGSTPAPHFSDLKVTGTLPSVAFTIPTSSSYDVPIAAYDVVVDGTPLITSASPIWAVGGLTNAGSAASFCSALQTALAAATTPAEFTVSCSGSTITVTGAAGGSHTANFNTANTYLRMTSIVNTSYAAKITAPTAPYPGPFLISNIPVRNSGIGGGLTDVNALGSQVVEFDQGMSQNAVAQAIATAISAGSGLSTTVSGGDVFVFDTSTNPPNAITHSPSTSTVYQAKYCTLTATAMDPKASGTIHSFKVNNLETLTGDVTLTPGESANAVAAAIAAKIGNNGFSAVASSAVVSITNGSGVTSCADPTSLSAGTNLAHQYGTLTTSAVTNTVPAYVTGIFANGGANLLASTLTETAGTTANQVAQSIDTGVNGNTGATQTYAALDATPANLVYISKPGVDISSLAVTVNSAYGQFTFGDVSTRGPAQITDVTVDGHAILPSVQNFVAGATGATIATALQNNINTTHPSGYYAVASGNVLYIYNPATPVVAAPTVTIVSNYGVITTSAVSNAPIYIKGVTPAPAGPANLLSATIAEPNGAFTPPVSVTAGAVASDLAAGINSGVGGYSASAVSNNVYVSKLGTDVNSISANLDATYGKLDFAAVSAIAPAQITAVTVGVTDILGGAVNLAAGTPAATVASSVAAQINAGHISGFYAFSNGASVYLYNNLSVAISAPPTATIVSSYGIITAQPIGAAPAYITNVTVNGTDVLYSGSLPLTANWTSNQVAAQIASAVNGVSGYSASSSGAFVYIWKQGTTVTGVTVAYSASYGQLTTAAVSNTVPAYVTGILVNGTTQLLPTSSLTEVQNTTANQVATDIGAGIAAQSTYNHLESTNNVYVTKSGVNITSIAASVASSYGLITPSAVSAFGPARITNIVLNGVQLLNGVNLDLAAGATAGSVATSIRNAINAQSGTTHYFAVLDPVSSAAVYVYNNQGTTISAAPTVTIVSDYGHLTAQAVSTTPAYINSIVVNPGAVNVLPSTLTEAAGSTATTVAQDIVTAINGGGTGFTALRSGADVYISKAGVNVTSVTVNYSSSYGILDATSSAVTSTVPAYVTGITVNGAGNLIPSGYVTLAAGATAATIASNIKNAINADTGSTGYSAALSGNLVYVYKNGTTITSIAATVVSSYATITPTAVSSHGPAQITAVTVNGTNLITGTLDFNANDTAVTVANAITNAVNARTGVTSFSAILSGSNVYIYRPGVAVSSGPTVTIVSKYGTLTATAVSSTVPAYVTGVFITSSPAHPANLLGASRTEALGSTANAVASDINTGINAYAGTSTFNSSVSGNVVYISKLGTDITATSANVNSTYGQIDVTTGVSANAGARITALTANATNLFGPGGYVDLAPGATANAVATAIYNKVHGATGTNGGYDAVQSGNTVYVYNPSVAISAAPSFTSVTTYGVITPNAVNNLGWAQISSITVGGTNIIDPLAPLNLAPSTTAATIATSIFNAVNSYSGTSGFTAILSGSTVYVYKLGTAAAAPVVNIIDTYATLTTSAVSNTAPGYITAVNVTSTPAYPTSLINPASLPLTIPAGTTAAGVATIIGNAINAYTSGFSAVVVGNIVYISRAGYSTTAAAVTSNSSFASLTPSNVGATPASVTGVYVNGGGTNIMGGTVGPFAAGALAATVATAITNAINAATGSNGGYSANQVGATVYVSHPTATVSTLLATTDATYAQLDASNVTNAPARINSITVMGTNVLGGTQIIETIGKTGTQVAADIASAINAAGTGYSANSSGNSVFIYQGGVAITAAPSSSVSASYGTITPNAVSANGRAEISQINVNGINLLAGHPVDLPAGTSANTAATAIATAINAGTSGYTATPNGAGAVYIYKQWVTVTFDATPVVATTAYGTMLVTSGNTATTPIYITGVFANGGANLLTSGSITVAAGATASTIAGQIVSAINGGTSGYWATNSGATVYISKYGVDVTTVTATYNNTFGTLPVTAVDANVPAQISDITVMGTDVLGGTPLNLAAGTTQAAVATAIANAINALHVAGYYAIASATDVKIYNPTVSITANPTATVIAGYGTLTANPVGATVPAYITGVFVAGFGSNLLTASRALTAGWTATQVATDIATGINASHVGGYSASSSGATVYVFKQGTNVTGVSATFNATYGTLSVAAVSTNGPARVTDVTVNGTDHILASVVNLAAGTTAANVAIAIANQINATHTLSYYAIASGSTVYIYNPSVTIASNPSATVISDYGILIANAVGANAPAYVTSVYVNGNAGLNLLAASRTLTKGWTATQVAADIATGINAGGSGFSATSSGANVYIYKQGTAVTSASASINATYGQLDLSAIGAGPVRVASVTVNATDLFAGHPLDIAANTTAANAAIAVANQINTYSGYTANVTGASVYITHPTLAITTNPSAVINANYGILTTTAVGSSPVPLYITAVSVTAVPAYGGSLIASTLTEPANTTANQVAIDIATAINASHLGGYSASYSANQVFIYKAGSDVSAASATVISSYGKLTVPSDVNANAPAQISQVTVNSTNLFASVLNIAAGTTTSSVAAGIVAKINANSGVSGYSASNSGAVVYIYSPTQTISSNPVATIISDYGKLTANAIGPVPGYITGVFVNGGGSIIVGTRTEARNSTAAAVAGDIGVAINANTGTSGWTSTTSGSDVYVYHQGTNVTSVSATINNATYGQLTFGAVSANGHARVTGITVNGTQIITGYVALSAGTAATAVASAVATNINTNNLGGYYAIASGADVYIYNVSVAIAVAPVVTISADYGSLTFASDVTATVPAYVTGVFPVPAPATPNILASSLTEAAGTLKNTVAADVATGINGNTGTSGYSASSSGNVVYLWKPGQSISSVSATINSTYGQLTFAAVNANAPAQVFDVTVNSTNILASPVSVAAGTTAANVATAVANQINATHTGGYYAVASGSIVYIYNPTVAISANPTATIVSGYGTLATNAVTGPVPATIAGVYANGGGTNLISGPLTEASGRTANQVASDIAAAINANTGSNGGFLATANANTVYVYKSGTTVSSVSATVNAGYGQLATSAVGNGTAYVTGISVNGGASIINPAANVVLAANETAAQVATDIGAGINAYTGTSGYTAVVSGTNVYIYNPAVASITSIVPASSTSTFGQISPVAVSALAPGYITDVEINGAHLLGSMQAVAAGSSAQTVAAAIQSIINTSGTGYNAALDAPQTSVIVTKAGVPITSATYAFKQPYAAMTFSAAGADPMFVTDVMVNSTNVLTSGVAIPAGTSASAAVALVQAAVGSGFSATASGSTLAIYSNVGADITSQSKTAKNAYKRTIDVGNWIGGNTIMGSLTVSGNLIGNISAANRVSLASAAATAIGTSPVYPYFASASSGVVTIYGATDPAPTYTMSYPADAHASATISIGPGEATFDTTQLTSLTIAPGGSCSVTSGNLLSANTQTSTDPVNFAQKIFARDKGTDVYQMSQSSNVLTVTELPAGSSKGLLNGCSFAFVTNPASPPNPPVFTVAPFSGGAGVITPDSPSGVTGGTDTLSIANGTVTANNGTGNNSTTLTLTPTTGLTTMVAPTPSNGAALAAPAAATGSSLATPSGATGIALAAPAATTGTTTTAPANTVGTALAALTPGTGTNGSAPTGSSAASMAAPTGGHSTTTTDPTGSTGIALTTPSGSTGTTSTIPSNSTGAALATPSGTTGTGMTAPTFGTGSTMTLPSTTSNVSLTLTPAFSYSLTFTYGNGASLVAPTSGNGHSTSAATVSTASSFTNPATSNGSSMAAPTGGSADSLATPTYATGNSLATPPSGSVSTALTIPATSTGTSFAAPTWSSGTSMSVPTNSVGTTMAAPGLSTATSLAAPVGSNGTSSSLSYSSGTSLVATNGSGSSMPAPSASYTMGTYSLHVGVPPAGNSITVTDASVGWPGAGSSLNISVASTVTGSIMVGSLVPFTIPTPGAASQRSHQGTFVRTDITNTCPAGDQACYGRDSTGALYTGRTRDCVSYRSDPDDAASVKSGWSKGCTYTEEMTNFANWYAYYRTRMQTMKTAAGLAFDSMGSSYRVGFLTIHPSSSRYTHVSDFNTDQRTDWYSKLYGTPIPNRSETPLRSALSIAGQIYAGRSPVDSDDPVQYYCQQNFVILTTDGFWFEGDETKVVKLDGSQIGNQDNTPAASGTQDPYYDGDRSATAVSCPLGKVGPNDAPGCNGNAPRPSCSPTASGGCDSHSTVDLAVTQYYSTNTLADVARYYYETDLRTDLLGNCQGQPVNGVSNSVCNNDVYVSSRDKQRQQHMVAFTVGLGVEGALAYSGSSYESASSGDYYDILHNQKAWPQVKFNDLTGADDLWHAAVNSHGIYFSAKNPVSLAASLKEALHDIQTAALGSAAAASNPVPNVADNFIYAAAYTTLQWTGQVTAHEIDLSSGAVGDALWCVSDIPAYTKLVGTVHVAVPACDGKLKYQIPSPNDSFSDRHIYLFSSSATNKLREFAWDNLTSTEQNYFDIIPLNQYQSGGLTATAMADLTNGKKYMVRYLRGESDHEARETNPVDSRLFRTRKELIGDVIGAAPVYVKAPLMSYLDAGYANYARTYENRAPTLYIAANDGMVHAFDASTVGTQGANTSNSATTGGRERWAYIPGQVTKNLWRLAQDSFSVTDHISDGAYYAGHHNYYVNGTPTVTDVCVANCSDPGTADWRTILVGGLKEGGRGYYALDVTDPNSPKGLWEFTPNSTGGANVGYAFGQPRITKFCQGGSSNATKTCLNPRWVVLVTSGYNNSPTSDPDGGPGDGKGYLFMLDPLDGSVIRTFSTNAGSATSPSGFANIQGFVQAPLINSYARYIYGGDLTGKLYRFDLETDGSTSTGIAAEMRVIASLTDPDGNPQPMTNSPALTLIPGTPGISPDRRFIVVGTGKYLEVTDQNDLQTQTIRGFFDLETYAEDGRDMLGDPRDPSSHMAVRTLSAPILGADAQGVPNSEWHRHLTGANMSNTDRGWYIDLGASDTSGTVVSEFQNNLGERVEIDMAIRHGVLYVATSVPRPSSVCSPGGHSWVYELDLLSGLVVGGGDVIAYMIGGLISGMTLIDVGGLTVPVFTDRGHDKVNTWDRPVGSNSVSHVQGRRSSWRELLD